LGLPGKYDSSISTTFQTSQLWFVYWIPYPVITYSPEVPIIINHYLVVFLANIGEIFTLLLGQAMQEVPQNQHYCLDRKFAVVE